MSRKTIIIGAVVLVGASFYVGRVTNTDPIVAYERGFDHAYRQISECTLEDAHAEKCLIPCATDADCLAKNGQTDH